MSRSHRDLPAWIDGLTADELNFIERFMLCSGSLKALAREYGVSYPTLRTRLDRLIDKMRDMKTDTEDGPLKARVRQLLSDGAISIEAARQIVTAYEAEEK